MTTPKGLARPLQNGELEEIKRASALCMDVLHTMDTGNLQYEFYFNDEESECVFLKRFKESEALIEHNGNRGDLPAMLARGWPSSEIFVDPRRELGAQWVGSPMRIYTPVMAVS